MYRSILKPETGKAIMIGEINRPPTLTSVTADAIRKAIFREELKPGESLREMELSRSLGVSRSTVREALHILQEDGLAEAIPHRGVSVVRLSPRTVEEIYTLRIFLEPHSVRAALENGTFTQQDIDKLESLVRQMGEFEGRGDVFSTVKLDQEFHQAASHPCGQHLILNVLKSVGFLTRLCLVSIKMYSADLAADELQHRQILDAIKGGDPDDAASVVKQHLVDARDRLLARMNEVVWEKVNKYGDND